MEKELIEKLKKGIETIVPENGLEEKIALAEKENRPLIIKFGMDPTAPDLHLGHAVGLKKLREFQETGAQIVLLVGDFTAAIGDPTGRNTTRPPLTEEEIKVNAQTYLDQMGKVIDLSKNVKIVRNSDWLNKMNFGDVLKLLGKATLAQMLQRDDFAKRFAANIPISLHELVYPMMQGYDSVALNSDIEFGGRDQLFNCLVGKTLQESIMGKPVGQTVVSMPLLRGLDGEMKMSKSKNNYIGLTEPANDMFGKTMSIPDELLPEWIELTTNFDAETKANLIADLKNGAVNPMEIKKKVAKNIVTQYHDATAADEAEAFFYRQVQQKGFDDKSFEQVSIAGLPNEISLLDLCAHVNSKESKSALRRLIESGAVAIDGEKQTDAYMKITPTTGLKIKIGKRGFFELAD
ncbi:MAG: tyrosine--tRNA ligase [Alphaproteobacteria bacterium]|nr:tyrosine--tRNA ligase [Alphaproteobacteria bacterium]